jgi:hypothetical protein
MSAYDIAAKYGVDYSAFAPDTITVHELVARGGRFTRIRLLTERGYPFMDISYIHAEVNGVPHHVNITFDSHSLRRKTYRSDLQAALIRDCGITKADVNRLGVWNDGTYSVLYG